MKNDSNEAKCGLYIRISRDEIEENRDSIASQKKILSKYCIEKSLLIVDFYIDSGISGTTFKRPNFIKLIEDLKHGKINTIMVKDLSRLGRNHLKVGKFIEEDILGKARLISIIENIDTNEEYDETIPLRNLVNEFYTKDLSKKVKSSIVHASKTRRISSITGGFYGYKPGLEKHTLIIDEEASRVIKRVFDLHIQGLKTKQIAFEINRLHVATPGYHRFINYNDKSGYIENRRGSKYNWKSNMIRNILNNLDYTGSTTQLKSSIVRGKTVQIPKSLQTKIENTHPAIISKRIFEKSQTMFVHIEKTEKTFETQNSLAPVVYNDTNHVMSYVKKRNGEYEYRARLGNRYGINSKHLHDIVKLEVKELLNVMSSSDIALQTFIRFKNIDCDFNKLEKMKLAYSQLVKKGSDLFNLKLQKKIDTDVYKSKMLNITNKQEELKKIIENLVGTEIAHNEFKISFKHFRELVINKSVDNLIGFAKEIIQRVDVYKIDNKYKVNINYKFINNY